MRRPVAVFKRLWKWLSKGDRRNTKELISSKSSRVGLQAAVIRATAGEDQGIAVRRIGWFETTSYTELDTAQRFCRLSYNALTRACPQLSQMIAAAKWIAARKFLAVLS
jgi:hypothetical protein